jgi:hypothetical protein
MVYKIFLYITLLLLIILDGILTYIGLNIYGIEAEGNPLVKYLISLAETPQKGLIILKAVVVGLLCITYRLIYHIRVRLLILLNILYFLVVLSWVYVLTGAISY